MSFRAVGMGAIGDFPVGIWCENDVGSTSMRRHHVASTLIRRHFCTKCPLGYLSLAYYFRFIGTHTFYATFIKKDNFLFMTSCLLPLVTEPFQKWVYLGKGVKSSLTLKGEANMNTLMCLSIGTPKNNKFSICSKWKIHYYQMSQNLDRVQPHYNVLEYWDN